MANLRPLYSRGAALPALWSWGSIWIRPRAGKSSFAFGAFRPSHARPRGPSTDCTRRRRHRSESPIGWCHGSQPSPRTLVTPIAEPIAISQSEVAVTGLSWSRPHGPIDSPTCTTFAGRSTTALVARANVSACGILWRLTVSILNRPFAQFVDTETRSRVENGLQGSRSHPRTSRAGSVPRVRTDRDHVRGMSG